MSKGYEPCYILWRKDWSGSIEPVVVEVILWTEEDATKEVTRLNNLEKKRAEKKGSHFPDSEYFWEVSRAKKR